MKRITSILFILMLSMGSVCAVTSVDSIRREMKHLKGKELLRAHSNLCRLAAAQDDWHMSCAASVIFLRKL